MMPFNKVMYVDSVPHAVTCVLAGDIGGTNANFGIFQVDNGELTFLFSMHYKSQNITHFPDVVKQLLEHVKTEYNITIAKATIAAAGVASETRDYAKPTNLAIEIDGNAIKQATGLEQVYIVNDFEVVGYGLDHIDKDDLVLVSKGTPRPHSNRAILGAGTGLGKCIMLWNHALQMYLPVASEGGHADAALQTPLELELGTFIREQESRVCNISWEDVLSGNGIQRMYAFFKSRSADSSNGNSPHPDEIFNSRTNNEASRKTFEQFTTFYARCAKNFALDALALGGVYIAGGIAAKNLPLFELPAFMAEFINCGKQQSVLSRIPIYVITDYNVSLYGAAAYILLEERVLHK